MDESVDAKTLILYAKSKMGFTLKIVSAPDGTLAVTGGRRRRRGGAGEQDPFGTGASGDSELDAGIQSAEAKASAVESSVADVTLPTEPKQAAKLSEITMKVIKDVANATLSVVGKAASNTKDYVKGSVTSLLANDTTAKRAALFAVVAAGSYATIAGIDAKLAADTCTPLVSYLADAQAVFGVTGAQAKCRAALDTYNQTMTLVKPAIIAAMSAATGNLVGVEIDIREGVMKNVGKILMKFIKARADESSADVAEPEDAPAAAVAVPDESVEGEAPPPPRVRRRDRGGIGGRRTRRHASKASKKRSRKSRR